MVPPALQQRLRSGRSIAQARASLAERLRDRREEIEQTTAARVYSISEPRETADPDYLHGLRSSLKVAVDYGLEAIERGEERAPAVPPTLLTQARMAARNHIDIEVVLRRYFAGYGLLIEFAIEEADQGNLLPYVSLRDILRGQAAIFDHLLAAVAEEHRREECARPASSDERRAERVRRLLAGEAIEASELSYDLQATHIGVVASGPGTAEAIRDLAAELDKHLLLVPGENEKVWAWLGTHRAIDPDELEHTLSSSLPLEVSLALGEPAEGLAGWRLTHRQARAAFPIASRSQGGHVRYSQVALLASMLQDELLATSLREIYLTPLAAERDGGEVLCETLRAYFAAERNVSSAAAVLGLSRQAVNSRLRTIESRLGRPLSDCAAELEATLGMEEFKSSTP